MSIFSSDNSTVDSSFSPTSSSFSSDLSSGSSSNSDKDLEEFIEIEKQKAQFNDMVYRLHEICWEKCTVKPAPKLKGKTETCLNNCVERFMDVSILVLNRFTKSVQKSEKLMN